LYNTFSSQKLISKLLFAEGAIVTMFLLRIEVFSFELIYLTFYILSTLHFYILHISLLSTVTSMTTRMECLNDSNVNLII